MSLSVCSNRTVGVNHHREDEVVETALAHHNRTEGEFTLGLFMIPVISFYIIHQNRIFIFLTSYKTFYTLCSNDWPSELNEVNKLTK